MTLYEFSREYDDLSEARRERGWRSLLERLARNPMVHEDFLLDLLEKAVEYEGDDCFGTEGLDV